MASFRPDTDEENRAKSHRSLAEIAPEYDAIFSKWQEGMSYSDIIEDVGAAHANQMVIITILIARIAELEKKIKGLGK